MWPFASNKNYWARLSYSTVHFVLHLRPLILNETLEPFVRAMFVLSVDISQTHVLRSGTSARGIQ